MKKLILTWFGNTFGLYLVDLLLDGVYFVDAKAVFSAGLILTILNRLLKPVLNLLTAPLNILTLGLASFLVNVIVLEMTMHLAGGAVIRSFGTACVAAFLLSVINSLIDH
jgi:putative membrane protein